MLVVAYQHDSYGVSLAALGAGVAALGYFASPKGKCLNDYRHEADLQLANSCNI